MRLRAEEALRGRPGKRLVSLLRAAVPHAAALRRAGLGDKEPVASTYRVKNAGTLEPSRVLQYLRDHLEKTALRKESFQKMLSQLEGERDLFHQGIIRKAIAQLAAECRWLQDMMESIREGSA
jgi:hypothetical protein